jgi:hypothetical protein
MAEDHSVFVVQTPGLLDYAAGLVKLGPRWTARVSFITGPRKGQAEYISAAELAEFQQLAEAKFGKYIPGSLFRDPRFIPGTDRTTLPYYEIDFRGGMHLEGYIDETGIHRYDRNNPLERYKRDMI